MDLLERDDQVAALVAVVDRACESEGAIAVVRGEAGVGKTSLVSALAHEIEGQAAVLWGNCDDLLTPQPMAPIWDFVSEHSDLADALARGDVRQVFQILVELLELQPTVLVIEDVHVADSATLDLITMIGRRIDGMKAVMVLTLRDGAPADHPVWRVLGELPSQLVHHVSPQPLSLEAVIELSGTERGEDIWRVTAGNPFLVTELAAADEVVPPRSVQDAIRARSARLTAVAQDLLELVSVVPGGAEVALVETADPSLIKAVDEAETSGLVQVGGGRISYRHELAREAVESLLSDSRRSEIHRNALTASEALGLDVARSAHHARIAGDVDAIIRLLPTAARSAAAAGNYREALAVLEALGPHFDELALRERAEVLELWAHMKLVVSGDGAEQSLQAVELRKQLGEPRRLGRSLLLASRAASYGGDHSRALELAREALGVVEALGGDDLARAHAELSRMAMMEFDFDRAIDLGESALQHTVDSTEVRANALTNIGVCKGLRNYPDGIDELEESIRICRAAKLELEQYRAIENLVSVAGTWFDFALIDELVETAELEDRPSLVNSLMRQVWHQDIHRGRLVAAYESALELLDHDVTQEVDKLVVLFQVAKAAVMLGRADSDEWVDRAWAGACDSGMLQYQASASTSVLLRAWYRNERDPDVVAEIIDMFDQLVDTTHPWGSGSLGLYLWFLGAIPELPASAPDPLRWMTEGSWRASADWFGERGAPFMQGLALSLGDVDARRRAVQIFSDIGARPHATLVRNQLRAEGVSDIPAIGRAPRDEHGLTKRQQEVLGLLAGGLTNAEIGERLFISSRTVEKHVAAVLAKLGVADRRKAAEAFRDASG